MKGQVFRRCTRCPGRARYEEGQTCCPKCGESTYTWCYIVDVGVDAATGKRRRKRKGGFDTKKKAETALRTVLAKVDHDRYVDPSKLTVGKFLTDEWLPAMRLTIEESTWEGYEGNVKRYIVPRIGQIPLGALKPPKINWLYADVRDNGRLRGEGPLSVKTVREVHVVLHRAFEDAVRWDYLETNPCDRANPPSATAAKNARKKAIQTWTAEEVQAFGAYIEHHHFLPVWLLAASTGMRRSELLGLRWQDLDTDRSMLAIRKALVVVDGKPKLKDAPKTQHGYRTIRYAPRVAQELADLRRRQLKLRMAAKDWQDHDLVFCRDDGLWWHPDHVTETIRELIEASGLPRIRPLQDLRHTHATLLIGKAGVNPKVVQERLGHHSYAFTVDTYTHLIPGMDEAASTSFDDLVFGTHDGPDGTHENKEERDA